MRPTRDPDGRAQDQRRGRPRAAVLVLPVLLVLGGVAWTWLGRQADAVGTAALQWVPQPAVGEYETVVVNGVRWRVTTQHAEADFDGALAAVAQRCRNGALPDSGRHADPAGEGRQGTTGFAVRGSEGAIGYVACAQWEGGWQRAWTRWVRRFERDGHLTTPGPVHIAWAMAQASGTRLVHLSTVQPLDLSLILPAEGDVPHGDLELPRPGADSRIDLDAHHPASGARLTVFTLARPLDAALRHYHAHLERAGFDARPAETPDTAPALHVTRAARRWLVTAGLTGHGQHIALVELPRKATTAPAADR